MPVIMSRGCEAAGAKNLRRSSSYTVLPLAEYWMDREPLPPIASRSMMPPRLTPNVTKLSDHGGQFLIIVTCSCGHTRTARPQTLARMAGWDALLVDVVKRMRCSKCGARKCSVELRPETKRDR